MSYDVGLYINTGKEEYEVHDCGNYTYNVSPMYYKVFPYHGIRFIDGMSGETAVSVIKIALLTMEEKSDELQKLNPDNGWGDFNGAVSYLKNILHGCEEHPAAIIRIY